MRSNRFWFIATVAIAFSVQGQDARSQPVDLVRVDGEALEAEVDLSDLTLTEAETFERFRDGISTKWNEATEKHRQLLQDYMELRFQEVERLSASGRHGLEIDAARYRRLKLARKGAIDRYLQEKHTQPADWYDEQAKALLTQIAANEIDEAQAVSNHINYESALSQDVDSVLTMIREIEASPLFKNAFNSTFSDEQRAKFNTATIERATATQDAYLQFLIASMDQTLLLTLPQKAAFKNLIAKHRPKITEKDLEEGSVDWEDAVTTLNSIPSADLRKILSAPQLQLCQESLSEFGIDFTSSDDDFDEAEAGQFDLRKLDIQLQVAAKSLLKTMSEMAPPIDRAKQAEAQAKRFVRRFMAAQVEHVKTVTQMSVADQVRFDELINAVVENYVVEKFKPLHQQFDSVAANTLGEPAVPFQMGIAGVNTEAHCIFNMGVDLSVFQPMLENDDFSAPQMIIREVTQSDAWKQALAKHLTPKQRDKLRADKFRRYIEPRDAYVGLLVFWMDRAMYLTPEKRDKLIGLVKQNQKPVTGKLVENSPFEDRWTSAFYGMNRTTDAELEKLLSPVQMSIWKSTTSEYSGLADEVEMEEDEPIDVAVDDEAVRK